MLKKIFIALSAILLLAITTLGYLASTNSGLKLTFKLAQKILPGTLTVKHLTGRVIGPLNINGLNYQDKIIQIKIKNFQLNWHPSQFLIGRLAVSQLQAENLTIKLLRNKQLPKPKKKTTKFKPPSLPITLYLQNVKLLDINVQVANQKPFTIKQLTLQADTRYQRLNASINLQLSKPFKTTAQMNLSGNLRKYQLNTQLQMSNAIIHAKGDVSQHYNINWQIKIPSLGSLLANTTGTINSQGKITGNLSKPTIVANVTAKNLHAFEIQANNLKAKMNIKDAGQRPSTLHLTGNKLSWKDYDFKRLKVNASGSLQSHRITANLTHKKQQIELNLQGGWQNEEWKGRVNQFTLNEKPSGTWKLKQPIEITASKRTLNIAPFCWESGEQKVCSHVKWEAKKQWAAQLTINQFRLKTLKPWFPEPFIPDGTVNLDANVKGDKNGITKGQFNLNSKQIELPNAEIKINNIQLSATANHNQLNYQGRATSKGQLTLTGKTLNKKNKITKLQINGDNFLVSNTAQIQIYLSPKLTATLQGTRLDINGQVTVPKATIKPPNYHNVVNMPNDVEYVQEKQETPLPLRVYSHITLILGKDIDVAYMGATGQVTGELEINDQPQQGTTANGRFSLINGSYNAYGQQLDIDRGIISYTGGPIDNPLLDIQASRKIKIRGATGPLSFSKQMLEAGINVTGTAANPKISFFSKPAGLSDTDILSYLILGKPASKAGNGSDLLLKAALALSSNSDGGAGGLMAKMEKNLGIDISFETEQTGVGASATQHSAATLGKYLTPHLYVSYGMDVLGGSGSVFRMRYTLNRYLSLQSEKSDLGNGVDLLYTLEKN